MSPVLALISRRAGLPIHQEVSQTALSHSSALAATSVLTTPDEIVPGALS